MSNMVAPNTQRDPVTADGARVEGVHMHCATYGIISQELRSRSYSNRTMLPAGDILSGAEGRRGARTFLDGVCLFHGSRECPEFL